MNRTTALRLAAAAAAAGSVPPGAAFGQARTAITVGALRSADMVNLYYSKQQGEFEKAGLDVTIEPMPNGAAALAAVVGGTLNIAVANVLSLAQAFQRGIGVRVIAPSGAFFSSFPGGNELLVAPDSPIRTAKDLEGKTLGVVSIHDLNVVAIYSWLDARGVDRSTVSFVEIPLSAMFEALRAGRVAAASAYDPFLTQAKASGARVLGSPFEAIGKQFSVTDWFVVEPWGSQHRDAVLRFASVINKMSPYINKNYESLIPLVASYSKLPEETLRKMTHPIFAASLAESPLQPAIDASAKYKEIQPLNAAQLLFPGIA